MKYGLIKYLSLPRGRTEANEEGIFNVGDNIQMLAIRRLLVEEMNINPKDIVEIDFHNLSNYQGDYLITPINLFFFGCHDAKETWFPASPFIIPVFIGVHFSCNYLTTEEVDYLRIYSPIGCRDEHTLSLMRKYNVPAYLFGCVTATFPKRTSKPKRKCLYLVDVDETNLLPYIPNDIKASVKSIHHVVKGYFSIAKFKEMDQMAIELIKEYGENASMVVTSRLHCASPCVALGIPTIMISDEKSIRYAWLDKIIKIYNKNEYSAIDWSISEPNYEIQKAKMVQLFISKIEECKQKYELQLGISSFWEFRKKDRYSSPFCQLFGILGNLDMSKYNRIIIWGATALAEDIFSFLQINGLENRFFALIDEYNDVIFHSKKSTSFDNIKISISKYDLIIITPTSAANNIFCKIRDNHTSCSVINPSGELFVL